MRSPSQRAIGLPQSLGRIPFASFPHDIHEDGEADRIG